MFQPIDREKDGVGYADMLGLGENERHVPITSGGGEKSGWEKGQLGTGNLPPPRCPQQLGPFAPLSGVDIEKIPFLYAGLKAGTGSMVGWD